MEPDPTTWHVIVTGGSSGLGAAVVDRLLDVGAACTVLDRDPPAREDVRSLTVDLADTGAAEQATDEAISLQGRIDAVVTCAGIDVPGPLDGTPRQDWERVVAVNLLGTAAVVRAALPDLRRARGRVVTIASTLGHGAVGDATAYCASKFGVVGFTRALMAELRDEVGVTLLTPGGMHTRFFDDREERYRPPPDARLADPCDVADAVVFALTRPPGLEVRELVVAGPAEATWP